MATCPRIAVVTTVYRPRSHSEVIVLRWLEPRPTDPEFGWPAGGSSKPRTEIASLYIAQYPENDIGRETAVRYGVPLFQTVREALTLGGDTLAVDGVLLIGEHGDYPYNELFQKLYPRRELFDEIVAVFRASGRSVPVFNDKHLSYDSESAIHMVKTACELGFPLMAGSSVPAAGFAQPWTMPDGTDLEEVVALFYCGPEIYGYHAIEFVQNAIAHRLGGEAGIQSVTAHYGEGVWEAESRGEWSPELMHAALGEAGSAQTGDYHNNVIPPKPADGGPHHSPVAFCFKHRDGLKSTYVMLQGHITDMTLAVRDHRGNIYSGCDRLSSMGADKFHPHFAMLSALIEEFMLTGESPAPVEHYLLSTLAVNAAMLALATPGQPVPTPEMDLQYHI